MYCSAGSTFLHSGRVAQTAQCHAAVCWRSGFIFPRARLGVTTTTKQHQPSAETKLCNEGHNVTRGVINHLCAVLWYEPTGTCSIPLPGAAGISHRGPLWQQLPHVQLCNLQQPGSSGLTDCRKISAALTAPCIIKLRVNVALRLR
jgi:hypothetical protein